MSDVGVLDLSSHSQVGLTPPLIDSPGSSAGSLVEVLLLSNTGQHEPDYSESEHTLGPLCTVSGYRSQYQVEGPDCSLLPHMEGSGCSILPQVEGSGCSLLPKVEGSGCSVLPQVEGPGCSLLPHVEGLGCSLNSQVAGPDCHLPQLEGPD